MARLQDMSEPQRTHIAETKLPTYDFKPWAQGPALNRRRVAIVSTAGIHRREDRPFSFDPGDHYRVIPGDVKANDLVMSHVSTNFDRIGFQQDLNIVFPLDRLNELAASNDIGSVAKYHYSFMGAASPETMEPSARDLAKMLLKDKVDALLLVPV
jgi:D-proline reductase (dithiol) PrdB